MYQHRHPLLQLPKDIAEGDKVAVAIAEVESIWSYADARIVIETTENTKDDWLSLVLESTEEIPIEEAKHILCCVYNSCFPRR